MNLRESDKLRNQSERPLRRHLLAILFSWALLVSNANAFTLIGPYADWMDVTNGYRLRGDIGGPMNVGEEYRWNVPVVTYGFDKSFVDYFGAKGVAAVESAIKILNDLPPVSSVVLSNYPTDSRRVNAQASSLGFYDLKSATLAALVEQMGLTSPMRHVFDLRQWHPSFITFPEESDWSSWAIPNYILERNFDPATFAPSHSVNGSLYSGTPMMFAANGSHPDRADVLEYPLDPQAGVGTAVADFNLSQGEFYTGLTRDDVGGLRCLLSKANVNCESLLRDVRTMAPFVAFRPGVEKIRFQRQLFDKKRELFRPTPIFYVDHYLADGLMKRRLARRLVRQPDFLFYAADIGENNFSAPFIMRTDTSNWVNNSALNGNPAGDGPGVIQPSIRITFHKLGDFVLSFGNSTMINPQSWGSFGSTNAPVIFPPATVDADVLTVHLSQNPPQTQTLQLPLPLGEQAALQISTNQLDWTTVAVVMNRGGVVEWRYAGEPNASLSFRVVPAATAPPPAVGAIFDWQIFLIEVERERTKDQVFPGIVPPPPLTPLTPEGSSLPQ